MSSESVCQVARSWVDVGSIHTRLFGYVCVTRGDVNEGSEQGTVSVHQILCQSGPDRLQNKHFLSFWVNSNAGSLQCIVDGEWRFTSTYSTHFDGFMLN
jgi:hypothetical protein